MLDGLFIHNIKVIRYASAGQTTLGESSQSSSIPSGLSSIKCRIENWDEIRGAEVEYRLSGHRPTERIIIYVPKDYLLVVEDDIYDVTGGSNIYLGKVVGVNPALTAFTTALDHYEIIIESP